MGHSTLKLRHHLYVMKFQMLVCSKKSHLVDVQTRALFSMVKYDAPEQNIASYRQWYEKNAYYSPVHPSVSVQYWTLATKENLSKVAFHGLHLRIPKATLSQSQNRKIALFVLHGGAFIAGHPEDDAGFAAEIASRLGIPDVFIPKYRLLPDHKLKSALKDCKDAWTELTENKGYRAHDVLVLGISSGATLALMLMADLKIAGKPQPCGAFLLSPLIGLELLSPDPKPLFDWASIEENKFKDVVTSAQFVVWAQEQVFTKRSNKRLMTRLLKEVGEGFPPLFISIGRNEAFYDAACDLRDHCLKRHIEVDFIAYREMQHVFQRYYLFSKPCSDALNDLLPWARSLFHTPGAHLRKLPRADSDPASGPPIFRVKDQTPSAGRVHHHRTLSALTVSHPAVVSSKQRLLEDLDEDQDFVGSASIRKSHPSSSAAATPRSETSRSVTPTTMPSTQSGSALGFTTTPRSTHDVHRGSHDDGPSSAATSHPVASSRSFSGTGVHITHATPHLVTSRDPGKANRAWPNAGQSEHGDLDADDELSLGTDHSQASFSANIVTEPLPGSGALRGTRQWAKARLGHAATEPPDHAAPHLRHDGHHGDPFGGFVPRPAQVALGTPGGRGGAGVVGARMARERTTPRGSESESDTSLKQWNRRHEPPSLHSARGDVTDVTVTTRSGTAPTRAPGQATDVAAVRTRAAKRAQAHSDLDSDPTAPIRKSRAGSGVTPSRADMGGVGGPNGTAAPSEANGSVRPGAGVKSASGVRLKPVDEEQHWGTLVPIRGEPEERTRSGKGKRQSTGSNP